MTTDTLALTEISIDALADVNGGWAREGLRDAGEYVGGKIDDAGMAIGRAAVATGNGIAAAGRFVGSTAVAASNAVRTGIANTLDLGASGLKAAGDWVRPDCR
jgi:hypothetical protein